MLKNNPDVNFCGWSSAHQMSLISWFFCVYYTRQGKPHVLTWGFRGKPEFREYHYFKNSVFTFNYSCYALIQKMGSFCVILNLYDPLTEGLSPLLIHRKRWFSHNCVTWWRNEIKSVGLLQIKLWKYPYMQGRSMLRPYKPPYIGVRFFSDDTDPF